MQKKSLRRASAHDDFLPTMMRLCDGQLMDNGCLERLAHMVIRDTQTAVQQRKVRPMRCQSILCTDPAAN